MSKEAIKLALEALEQTLKTLENENEKPNGAIADTVWYSGHETLFDYLASQITALREALEKQALHELAAESLNEGLRLDDWNKIGCVNHDCDKCKAEQKDAARYQHIKGITRAMSLDINGNHYWTVALHGIRGPSLDEAIDRAIEAAHGIKE